MEYNLMVYRREFGLSQQDIEATDLSFILRDFEMMGIETDYQKQ